MTHYSNLRVDHVVYACLPSVEREFGSLASELSPHSVEWKSSAQPEDKLYNRVMYGTMIRIPTGSAIVN